MNRLTITIIALFSYVLVNAQQDSLRRDSILNAAIDEMMTEDGISLYELFDGNTKYHFLYFGTTFNTKAMYAGQEIPYIDAFGKESSLYNGGFQLYYFISNGLYFGASGAWYKDDETGFKNSVVSLGYTDSPKKLDFFRYRLSYDRFIYLNMGPDYEPTFSSDINIGTTLKYKNIGARIDYTLLLGKDTVSPQLSVDLFARFKLLDLGGIDRVQFKPEISAFFGSEIVEVEQETNSPFISYEMYTDWGRLNTQLILPLNISYKDFDFDVAFVYNYPTSLNPDFYLPADYYKTSYYFRFSLGYILKIK
jgi:hypothetical protein